jgi:hypothetical protein
LVWEVRQIAFYPNNNGVPGKQERLLILREVLTGEVKYFLSNGSAEVPLKTLLLVAFSRWRIERLFEDGKGEVGFDHFEVRCYRSLIRHLILTTLSLYFLCGQTDRLRKKNPGWMPSQVKDAVEVQLDPEMPPQERTRRLEKTAEIISHWQAMNAKAAFYHDKRRRREMRALGIDLRKVRRCLLRI